MKKSTKDILIMLVLAVFFGHLPLIIHIALRERQYKRKRGEKHDRK